jgi:hypothetical protein
MGVVEGNYSAGHAPPRSQECGIERDRGPIMIQGRPRNSCRVCAATSYRPVIARGDDGAMRATGQYKCSKCSVLFRDLSDWRDGAGDDDAGSARHGLDRQAGSSMRLAA